MKNFRNEFNLGLEDLEAIRAEVLQSGINWGEPRRFGTHTGQRALYLNAILPLPKQFKHLSDPGINPFIIKSEASVYFPKTLSFIRKFAEKKGDLCRIVLFNLKEGGDFSPHKDLGEYYKVRDRYHLVVVSVGSLMKSGYEECIMNEGELWWINNKEIHSGKNISSETPRIHIVFDILPLNTDTSLRKLKRKVVNQLLVWVYQLSIGI